MKVSEAKELVCPFMSNMIALDGIDETIEKLSTANCICEKCIFWVTTVNGKKEIDRVVEPYDMTLMDIRYWVEDKERDGYENIGRQGGFRDNYAKYEESHEGYCKRLTNE